MIEINGTSVRHWAEYSAEIVPGKVVECESEAEARALAEAHEGGKVLVRHVYETAL